MFECVRISTVMFVCLFLSNLNYSSNQVICCSFFPLLLPLPFPPFGVSFSRHFPSVLLPSLISPLPPSSLGQLAASTERPQPPRKLSVPQDGVESRRLRLHWVTGGSGSSPLRYFTLQVKELPSGDWNTHTADILYNVTTWTVDRYTRAHMYTHTHTHISACVACSTL